MLTAPDSMTNDKAQQLRASRRDPLLRHWTDPRHTAQMELTKSVTFVITLAVLALIALPWNGLLATILGGYAAVLSAAVLLSSRWRAWDDRDRCGGCGYRLRLSALRVLTNCPECGRSNGASEPEADDRAAQRPG
jgi:hypothetical protein